MNNNKNNNNTHKIPWDFEIQMDHLISARWPDQVIVNKKKRTYWIVDFAILADHKVKLQESKKFLDFTWELKKLCNMKVMVIPFVIGILGTVTKALLQGLKDLQRRAWVETIQTSTLLRSARILRRVLETWEELVLFRLQWKTIS